MSAIAIFEAAADAGIRMFVREGRVIMVPASGQIDGDLRREIELHREAIRSAVILAAEVIQCAGQKAAH